MSLEDVVLIVLLPALIAALILSLVLGYGRRIGGRTKAFGWIAAIALVAVPLLLLSFANHGLYSGDTASAPMSSDGGAEPEEAASEDDVAVLEVPAEPGTRSANKRKRPTTSRSVRRRNADGSETTTTVTVNEPLRLDEEATEEEAAETAPSTSSSERKIDEKFDTVDVFFGTDRNPVTSGDRLEFGSKRAGRLTLGKSTITIPKEHDRGIVERPWEVSIVGITIYKQSEDPAKHFTVQKIGVLDEPEFIAASNAHLARSKTYRNQAAIFVHGYNNDFDTAIYRTAQMVFDMGFDGTPYLYSWPSAAGYSTYEYDQQSARQSIEHLSKFIEIVTEKTSAEKIHVVAHSMGNDVLLEALRELRFKFGPDHDYKISQVILAAPDVDRNVFERLARQIAGISDGVTLYASANDKALQFSRTYAGGVARAGDVPEDGPVVINGVDTIDVSATQQDFWGINHNTYAEVSELLQDIKRILLTGLRPPVNRTPSLEVIPVDRGTYWRFPPKPEP